MMYQLIIPAGSHAKEFAGQPYFIRSHRIGTDIVAYGIAVHQAQPGGVHWVVAVDVNAEHQIKLPDQLRAIERFVGIFVGQIKVVGCLATIAIFVNELLKYGGDTVDIDGTTVNADI